MQLVSTKTDGTQLTGGVYTPVISPDGRYVAFTSYDVIDSKDTNGSSDVFLKDLDSGKLIRVSLAGDDPGDRTRLCPVRSLCRRSRSCRLRRRSSCHRA